MEEYTTYRLGDIAECTLGKMLDQKKNKGNPQVYLGNVAVRWGSFNVDPSQTMLFEDKELDKYQAIKGDIVLCEGGEPGRCAIWEEDRPICIQKALHRIRVTEDIASPYYVYYYLTNLVKSGKAEPFFTGSTIKHLPREKLISLELSLPCFEEQKRRAAIIRSLDDKIALNNRINHNLEEQAQALYKSWFVDFEPFKGGQFVDSELGMIPEGWHVGTLSELLEVRYGKDHKALKDGNTPVFGSGGLMRYAERALYNGESVLIPRKGTLNNVMYFNGPFWTVDTMFYTVERSSNVIKYCHLFLLTQDLASMNAGSAVPSMTTDILNNLPLLIPSSQVLEAFNRVLSSIYEARSQREEESNSLSQSRDTILPQLMSGALTNTLLTC